jgi:hypothetical protein
MFDIARDKGEPLRKGCSGDPAVIIANVRAGGLESARDAGRVPRDVLVDFDDAVIGQ